MQQRTLVQALQASGYSLTQPRQLIFETLANHEAQSLAQLEAHCQNRLNRSTIYRTIDLFEQLGIVQRLQIGWKYKLELTATYSHHHHHLTCLQCGIVIVINEEKELELRLKQLAQTHGFTLGDHQIELRGLCQACRSH